MTTSAVRPARASRRPRPWTYTRIDALATLLRPDMVFFTIILPLGMYLFWGAMQDYSDVDVGRGNVAASTMINMTVFSVSVAATCTAAGAAVERAGGWGRQVALTPGGLRVYTLAKIMTAIIVSVCPAGVIFLAGALTGAHMDAPWLWAASYVLALVAAVPSACFGLAAGMWIPAQAAVGIAGTCVSLFAFMGNLFMPLGGTLFALAHYTPLYGVGSLATAPLQEGYVATTTGTVHEDLWVALASIGAWTVVFVLTALAARRHVTARR